MVFRIFAEHAHLRGIKIAVVGKYFNSGDFVLSDVYISVLEAIKYSSYKLGLKPEIIYLSANDFTDKKNPLFHDTLFTRVYVKKKSNFFVKKT